MSEITKALVKFHKKGGVKNIEKDAQANPKSDGKFNYKYSTIGAVINAIREPLAKVNIVITQTTDFVDNRAILITTLRHISGETISSKFPLYLEKKSAGANDMQNAGSTITYSRRYCLLAILNLASDDDDGASSNAKISKPKSVIFSPNKEKTIENVDSSKTPLVHKNIHEKNLLEKSFPKLFEEFEKEIEEIEFLGRLEKWGKEKATILNDAKEKGFESEVKQLSKQYQKKLKQFQERKKHETSV